MFHRHQKLSLSSVLVLLGLVLLLQPSHAVATTPISFDAGTKTGNITGSSTTMTVSATRNDLIVVLVYVKQTSGQSVSTMTDNQGGQNDVYTRQLKAVQASIQDFEIWTARAATTASTTITITLTASATFGAFSELFVGVLGLGTSGSLGTTATPPNSGIQTLIGGISLTTVNSWVVGGQAIDTADNCFSVLNGNCGTVSCPILGANNGCINQLERQADQVGGNVESADMEDSNTAIATLIPTDPTAGCNLQVGWCFADKVQYPTATVHLMVGFIELTCCLNADPPAGSTGTGGSAGPGAVFLDPITITVVGGFVVAGVALILKGGRRQVP